MLGMYKYPNAKKIKAARSYTIPEVAEVLGCTTRTGNPPRK